MNLKLPVALCVTGLLVACGPSESTDPANPDGSASAAKSETETMTQTTDSLTGTRWQVEDIAGGGVIDRSPATVEFPEPGRVAGNASCNRYMGGYEQDGEKLAFGNLAGTLMACPEPLMAQEQRFHQAMGQVTGWRLDGQTDLLHLVNEAGETMIRASRMPAEDSAGQ
jgi:heat shock protein HslJ